LPAKTILLVEDSAADVYLIRRAVAECGQDIQLWVMADGPEALAFLRKEPPLAHVPTPALIIVDLSLPKMRGTKLITAIRQLPAHRTTPLFVLSATPKEHEEQHCLHLGATAYVQKVTNFYTYFADIKAIVQHGLRAAEEREEALS
jgi:CheY-like chemotaxis protein